MSRYLKERERRQREAYSWARECFPTAEVLSIPQRGLRSFEEGAEVAQSTGVTREEAHRMVDEVWSRPVGDLAQEIGGAQLTLLVLAEVAGIVADKAEVRELERVLSKPREHFAKRNAEKALVASLRKETPVDPQRADQAIGPLAVEFCQWDHGGSLVVCHKERGILARIEPLNDDEEPDMHEARRQPWDLEYAKLFAMSPVLRDSLKAMVEVFLFHPQRSRRLRALNNAKTVLAELDKPLPREMSGRFIGDMTGAEIGEGGSPRPAFFTCRSCGREEGACSADPCAGVIAAREAEDGGPRKGA